MFQSVDHLAVAVGEENLPCSDRVIEEIVDDPVADPGPRHVELIFRITGLVGAHRMGRAERRLRPVPDQGRRPGVRDEAVGLPVVQLQRIPVVELVEDVPQIDIRGDLRYQILQVAEEIADIFPLAELPFLLKPLGVGEVMQREAEPAAASFEFFEHRKVSFQRLLVVPPFLRFDPRPFDRHAEHLVAQFVEEGEILFPEVPEVARLAGGFRIVLRLFPVPVGTVNVVAFDLVAGGRRTPDEILRKPDLIFHGKNTEHTESPF